MKICALAAIFCFSRCYCLIKHRGTAHSRVNDSCRIQLLEKELVHSFCISFRPDIWGKMLYLTIFCLIIFLPYTNKVIILPSYRSGLVLIICLLRISFLLHSANVTLWEKKCEMKFNKDSFFGLKVVTAGGWQQLPSTVFLKRTWIKMSRTVKKS